MKTQEQQIKTAKRAYILKLTQGTTVSRFAVYLDAGKGLTALWPKDAHEGKEVINLLPHQVFYKKNNNRLPAFHFAVHGVGLNRFEEVKDVLHKHNPKLEVFGLNGWHPSING